MAGFFSQTKETPLQIALANRNPEIILLIADFLNSSDLERPINTSGETLLHFAAENGFENLLAYLLSRNVAVDPKRNTDNATPLHLASMQGKQGIAQLLINRGADIQAACERKSASNKITKLSVLSCAIYSNSENLVIALLAQGAAINQVIYHLAKNTPVNSVIYNAIVKPYKENKSRIMNNDTIKNVLGKKIERYHLTVQQILSQVYIEDHQDAEIIAKDLDDIMQSTNEILKPLLTIIAFGTQGFHRLDKKPLKLILTKHENISLVAPIGDISGGYNGKNTIFCSKSFSNYSPTILHESQHFADKCLFEHAKLPCLEPQENTFLNIIKVVGKNSLSLPENNQQNQILKNRFNRALFSNAYTEAERVYEILVKVPEVIGYLGINKGYAWLQQHQPELLHYYEHQFNPSACRFIAENDILEKLENSLMQTANYVSPMIDTPIQTTGNHERYTIRH